MPRYAAFLRGISPVNAKMSELAAAFEGAGFTGVATVLGSGNVVFDARAQAARALEKKAEQAMSARLGRTFLTIVRPVEALEALLASDPFAAHRVPRAAKRVVTFLREPFARSPLKLPVEQDGATIYEVRGGEVFTAYVPSPRGAVFMVLLEKTFGKEATTRTWDTVAKVARK